MSKITPSGTTGAYVRAKPAARSTSGSTGVEVRNDGGREAAYDFTITALEEGKVMALEAESKEALFWFSYTFEDRDEETVVTAAPRMKRRAWDASSSLIAGNFRKQLHPEWRK